MKVSIIIPVYNVEKYLKQCVESVLQQSYQNYEIILIDDGSTDSSGKMCEQLARKDSRICVFHKENGGLSDARNTGVQEAKGEYLMFLDSDDYWDTDCCLQVLMAKLEQNPVDILTFRYKKYIEDSNTYLSCLPDFDEKQIDTLAGKNDILKCLLQQGLYLSSACNKVLRTKFVQQNQLYFRKGITSEDIDWCARCMIAAETIGYSNVECYVYRQRRGSISHNLSYRNINDLKNNIVECIRLGSNISFSDPFYESYYTFVAYQYGTFIYSNNLVQDERVAALVKEMKEYRWVLKFNSNRKIKLLYLLDKGLGYYNMIRCMKLYTKIRKG